MAASIGAPDPIDGVKREPYGFHLKYCTSSYKDAGQMRRRFMRRGRQPFHLMKPLAMMPHCCSEWSTQSRISMSLG